MTSDQLTIRIVVLGIAVLTATAVVGAIVLQLGDKDAAQAWQLAGVGLGALGGILVQARTQGDPNVADAVGQVAEQARAAGSAQTEAAVMQLDKAKGGRLRAPSGG